LGRVVAFVRVDRRMSISEQRRCSKPARDDEIINGANDVVEIADDDNGACENNVV
jgi:hypothetical protein